MAKVHNALNVALASGEHFVRMAPDLCVAAVVGYVLTIDGNDYDVQMHPVFCRILGVDPKQALREVRAKYERCTSQWPARSVRSELSLLESAHCEPHHFSEFIVVRAQTAKLSMVIARSPGSAAEAAAEEAEASCP